MFEILLLGLAAAAAIALGVARREQSQVAWQAAAQALGLIRSGGGLSGLVLRGRIDGYEIHVEERRNGKHTRTAFSLIGHGAIPSSLAIGKEGLLATLFEGRDTELGDEAFDSVVRVGGEEIDVVATLGRDAREQVLSAVRDLNVAVYRGWIRVEKNRTVSDAPTLIVTVKRMVDLARYLSVGPGDAPRRLAQNVETEDVLALRLKSLSLLHEHFPETSFAKEASLKACEHSSPEMKLQGAMFVGDIGRVTEVASLPWVDEQTGVRAVSYLVENAAKEEVVPLLEMLVASRHGALATTAIDGLGRLRHTPSIGRLAALVRTAESEADIAVAVAGALGAIGDPSGEPILLDLLTFENPEVKSAAARALGLVGTIAAVEPLLPYTKGFLDTDLQTAARGAVHRIQSRIGNVDAGRLTLSDTSGERGGLTVAAAGGDLSLVKDNAPQKGKDEAV